MKKLIVNLITMVVVAIMITRMAVNTASPADDAMVEVEAKTETAEVAKIVEIAGTIEPAEVTEEAEIAEVDETAEVTDGIITGCTIRTTKEVKGYSAEGTDVLGVIPKDTRLCVVAESTDKFCVLYEGQSMWINSANILINIKEYIPSLVINLDMAQEKNLFTMGDEPITGLTDCQLYTSEGSVEGTEAWLRYEVAQKLLVAQQLFLERGYSIVIYDAYRPYSVTIKIRDAFSAFLATKPNDFKKYWFGELGESWFLAQKASSHNYGVAVDMTLVDTETGEEVVMPQTMHALDFRSAYSTWGKGDDEGAMYGNFMKEIMENVGFSSLKSEWWHFQDNTVERGSVLDLPN